MCKRWHWISLLMVMASVQAEEQQGNKALEQTLTTGTEAVRENRASQQKIDTLDEQTRSITDEYRSLLRQTEALRQYNQDLAALVTSQEAEVESLQAQIRDVELTQREISPLMRSMVDVLEQFVKLDTPFLEEERTQRIAQIREMMGRADVTIAEKFRRVLEAYQIENEYGRTLEHYQDELEQNGATRTVNFVRIGRVGLFYETLDGREAGRWDADKQDWVHVTDYQRAVHQALRIAKREVNPDFLVLPMPAPVPATKDSAIAGGDA